jgi:hypothetical protein
MDNLEKLNQLANTYKFGFQLQQKNNFSNQNIQYSIFLWKQDIPFEKIPQLVKTKECIWQFWDSGIDEVITQAIDCIENNLS